MKKHLLMLMLFAALFVPWASRAQVSVTIGDGGTTTNSYLPIYTLFNNTLSEQIYTPAEVTMAGTITSIAFYNGGSEKTPLVKIYMINTNQTEFSSTTNWLPVTASDLVFQGNVTFTAGQWTTITLDSPFSYDGVSNLGLVVDGNLSWSSGLACRVFSSTTNCAMYVYSDGTDYSAVGATYTASNRLSVKNQLQLNILPANMSCFPVRSLHMTENNPDQFTLAWSDTNNSGATYYIIDRADSSVLASTTDTFYTITSFVHDTTYHLGVFVDCGGGDSSMISNINVTTTPSCLQPTQLTIDSVTTEDIALHWTAGYNESEWVIFVGDSVIPSITDTFYTITDLTLNTLYTIRVAAVCSSDDTSAYTQTTARTLAGEPINTFPYSCGFDTPAECADWVLDNGTQTNYWMIGTATSNGGDNSLYITNNGSANAYTVTSISHVWAYATFSFADSGEYAFSYDWKCQGESRSYDWLRVFLAPASADFAAGSPMPFGASTYAACTTAVSNGWIDLSNRTVSPYTLAQTNTWTNETGTFVVGPGTYKLVFLWSNDGSGGTQPPAAVDNIQIVHNTCPQVQNLTATYVSTDSITIGWTAGGSETSWLVQLGNEDPIEVSTTTYTFDELYANTPYTITVRAICDVDDSSMASIINVRTACGTMALPYFEDFDSYTTSTTAATGITPACWDYSMTNSSYASASYVPQIYYTTTTYYHHSGAYSLRLYGLSYTVLPVIPDNVDMNQLSMSFWAMHTSASYALIVGVMTDPDSLDSFDTIQVINYPGTSAQYNFEIDFSNYTGTGRYIAFRNYHTSYGYSYNYIDDISVWRNSTCATPTYVNVTGISNDVATVNWGEEDTANYTDVVIYWATVNNIDAADSLVITDGSTNTLLTGLTGSTTYYVWVKGNCTDEPSRAITTSFTITPDCVPVQNLTVAGVDYHAFGLQWDAPTAGHPATEYIVSWKYETATAWQSDTVTTTYYYISGLGLDSLYQYRVTTVCDEIVSAVNSGSARTLGCGSPVTNGGTTNIYLPLYQFYGYSYTQQIYLAEELTDVDTISTLSFYTDGTVDGRPVVLYLANTSKAVFANTSDYVPASALTQVASTTFSGTGWMTFNLTTPFVRNADSNLVVVVDDNTGSYTSSVPWAATSTSTARGLYFYQDGTNINPSSPSATSSSTANYVNQILISGPTCSIPDCGRPILFVSNIGTNSADITWNTESGMTYEVAYQQVGDTTWTIVDAANTTGTASITGLTPALDWTVRVSTSCNGTSINGTSTFATLCGPVALPYTENFENVDYGVFNRNCWVNGSTNLGTSYPNPYVISLTGDPNKLCLIYQGGYLIMPEMDAPLNELQIRFKFVQGGDGVRCLLGLMQNPEFPITAIHVLDTLIRSEIDTTTATVYITYSFANIETAYNHAHITFWDAFADNYNFIDDVVVEYIPQCSPASDFSVSTTDNSASISWNVNGANGTSYIVEYGPHNFTPGTGTTVTGAASPINLTGLNHSTSYDAYIYTVCGGFGDTSIASPVVMFTTDCAPIVTLPYSTDFENILPAGSGSSVVMVPNCWATEAISGTAPRIYYTTTTDYTSSPSHSLYFYDQGIVALPEMGMSIDSLMVSFYDYNPTPGTYGLVIGAVDSITPGFAASFQPIDTIPFELGVNSYNVVSFLSDYTGSASHIAIKNYNAAGNSYATHYIDDLTINIIPSCIAPQRVRTTALTNVSADLEWRISQAPNYSVEYGVHGFVPGTGTTVTTTTRSVSLTGLTPFTTYDVRLVSLCSASETSDTTVYTFTTLRAAPVTSYPYICDFADSAEANAWEPVNGSQTNQWYLGTAAHYGTADNYGMYVSDDNGTSNSYNVSGISITYAYRTFTMNAGSYNVAFKWQAYGESSYDYLRAWLVPDNVTLTAGQLPDGSNSTYNYQTSTPAGWIDLGGKMNYINGWQSFNNDVSIANAGNYKLVFMWGNDGSAGTQPPAAVDNIEIYLNTCPAPANIYASTAGTTYLNLDWDDLDTTFVAWNVQYGPAGYTFGSTAATNLHVTSHPVMITGLDTLTAYDFYVQPICSGNDTGRWSNPATISTEFCDNAFAATTGNATGTNYYTPLNNFYRYTFTETIIDSAELAGIGEITSIAYSYSYSTTMTDKTDVTIWLQPTNKTVFTSSSDAVALDTTTAVQVYSGSLNCSQGWNYFAFSTPYTWDGHSNLLVIVDDNSNEYDGSSYVFNSSNCNGYKTIHYYSDSYNPDPLAPGSFSGTMSYVQYRATMKLVSCGGCATPTATLTAHTYESATISVDGAGESFELDYGTDPSNLSTTLTSTNGTFNITGLTPATQYFFAARQQCDSATWSSDFSGVFVTDSLPCMPVTGLDVNATSYTSVTLTWTAGSTETAWEVMVYNTVDTHSYTATTTTFEAAGLTSGATYNADVRPLCGSNHNIEGDWTGTPVSFTTDICQPVTGVTVGDVTGTTATVTWTAAAEGSGSYRLEYGYAGFNQGQGTSATANTNSYTITGLETQTMYDVYVANICTETLASTWSTKVTFETTDGGGSGEGIADVDAEGNLTLYPNPATTTVTLTVSELFADAELAIVDLNGRTVMTANVSNMTTTFDISTLTPGAYFVRLTGEKATTVRKLIVK